MQKIVVVDFETANPKRVSACSVGGCVIEEDVISESFSTFIKPPDEFGEFTPFNVRVHGITPDKVVNAPTFEDLFPRFLTRVDGNVVVSYSKFDLSVINSLLGYYGHSAKFKHIDACALAKERLPGLKNYKLPTVAKHLGFGDFKHHDAAEDAMMCAKVFLALKQSGGNTTHRELVHTRKESFADAFGSFVASIVEDGVIDYKEAVELVHFLEVLPPLDVVKRLHQTVTAFLDDGEISDEESDILILQLSMAVEQFSGKPYSTCPVCGGPLLKELKSPCPWCLAQDCTADRLDDDAETHLDSIAESM